MALQQLTAGYIFLLYQWLKQGKRDAWAPLVSATGRNGTGPETGSQLSGVCGLVVPSTTDGAKVKVVAVEPRDSGNISGIENGQ